MRNTGAGPCHVRGRCHAEGDSGRDRAEYICIKPPPLETRDAQGERLAPEEGHRSPRESIGHREQGEPEEHLEVRQYAVHIRRVKKIRVKVRGRWKTMQDVSDWWL